MWNDFTYDKIKDRLIIVDVDDKPIYIHDGQYIINFQDPYGQKVYAGGLGTGSK